MSRPVDRSLEQAIASGTLNAYMIGLLAEPRLDSGDVVTVPKDRLRHYIRSAREQLRGRTGRVQYHVVDRQYLVEFEASGHLPGFEKVIPLVNLARV